jgi:DNA repair protein RecO (recombination protein O)
MALVTTEAIVLHTYPYGETSKIVRLATPQHGVISAVAKGAHRPKSRFGARLQQLSGGAARVYMKASRELHTLAEFDVTAQRGDLALDLPRYAAAAALAEVVLRCSPQEPRPEVYAVLADSLNSLSDLDHALIPGAALTALWSLVAALGFAPALDACAVDGNGLPDGPAAFSVLDGGLVCARCTAGRTTSPLPGVDRRALSEFVAGDIPEEPLPTKRAVAHRRLLARFIRRHVSENRELKAVDFWERQS